MMTQESSNPDEVSRRAGLPGAAQRLARTCSTAAVAKVGR